MRRPEPRLAAVEGKAYMRKEIGERDGWECGHCLTLVSREADPRDPRAPQVDHITAIVQGGADTRDNVTIAPVLQCGPVGVGPAVFAGVSGAAAGAGRDGVRGPSRRGALAGRAAAGMCPGLNPFLPLIVILLSCDSPLAQWQPDDPGAPGGPLRWHNSACPGLCLTGLGNEQQVLALACDDSPSQRWWDNSREVSDRAWEPGDGRFRLRAWNGLYLDQFGEPGRDGTALTTRRRNDVNTQRWDMEYAGLGDNIVRLKGLGSGGRCVDILDTHEPRPSECSLLHDCTDRGVRDDGTPLAGGDVRGRFPPFSQRGRAPVPGALGAGGGLRDDRELQR
ncbi:hypothetical protein ACIF83_35375 [Streptomyces sp. NPDC085866]|uniref:hypothetical protein n=1 Tax=Streptomyces sp. NPDC085866 TaxID=3365736 RepID=UPI0037D4036B